MNAEERQAHLEAMRIRKKNIRDEMNAEERHLYIEKIIRNRNKKKKKIVMNIFKEKQTAV